MIKVLFVCKGNICRSPLAAGVFAHLVRGENLADKISCDSVGTTGHHAGEAPDPRAVDVAQRKAIDITGHRAAQIDAKTLSAYKLIICMDNENYEDVMAMCHPDDESKVKLLLFYAGDIADEDVPDPYYGGEGEFTHAMDLIEQGCKGLLTQIQSQLL